MPYFAPKETLLAMDFDNTITDKDSACATFELAPGGELPQELKSIQSQLCHPYFMDTVFHYLRKEGLTADDILRHVRKIPMAPGMKELLLDLYNSKQEAIIVSDSNSAFIEIILQHKHLNGIIPPCNVYTNRGCVDQRKDMIRVWPFTQYHECEFCPPHMCKGEILMKHMRCRERRGLKTIRIIFVADGTNDFCPCLRLGSQDIVFCRKRRPLERMLKCEMAKPADECRLWADIRFYDDAYKIRRLMRINNVYYPARNMTPPTMPESPPTPCDPEEDEECEEEEEEEESTETESSSDKSTAADGAAAGKGKAAPAAPEVKGKGKAGKV